MIEADLAELVDDHGGLGQRRVMDQAVEQRGLAGAEKARQHGEGDGFGRPLRPRWPAVCHLFCVTCSGSPVRRLFGPPAWAARAATAPLGSTRPAWRPSPRADWRRARRG